MRYFNTSFNVIVRQSQRRLLHSASQQLQHVQPQQHLRSMAFIETRPQPPSGAVAASHKLLEQGGFVKQSAAGVFMMLPLGLRVMERIEAVIHREMQSVGAQKVEMPQLLSADLWKVSGRWDTAGKELFRLQDRKGHDFCLGPTHEEIFTDLVASLGALPTHRLPIRLYQIGRKYRDEVRPRFGLLRGREFTMKDMYTFDVDGAAGAATYDQVCEAYTRVFKTLELKTVKVRADSGNIGGDVTHEFHVLADIGEDDLSVCSTGQYASNIEVAIGTPSPSPEPLLISAEALVRAEVKWGNIEPHGISGLVYSVDETQEQVLVLIREGRTVNKLKLEKLMSVVNGELVTVRRATSVNVQEAIMKLQQQNEINKSNDANNNNNNDINNNRNVNDNQSEWNTWRMVVDEGCGFESPAVPTGQCVGAQGVVCHADVVSVQTGDKCCDPDCTCCGKGHLKLFKGIEVGQAFVLGTKYSSVLGAFSTFEKEQQRLPLEMGCYGLGVSRIMAAILEQHGGHDKRGMKWPVSVAPFHAVVLSGGGRKQFVPQIQQKASDVQQQLSDSLLSADRNATVLAPLREVMFDDRHKLKFKARMAEAELIGYPWIVVVAQEAVEADTVEVFRRETDERLIVSIDEALRMISTAVE